MKQSNEIVLKEKPHICKCGHARGDHINSMFKNPGVCMICNCRKYREELHK